MFGALISIALFGYLGIDAAMKAGNNTSLRQQARTQGKKYYMDNKNRYRSVDTNEICIIDRDGFFHNKHNVCYGIKTGRIVDDATKNKAAEFNEELEKNGKAYYYKEYSRFNQVRNKNTWYPIEKETGRPFEIRVQTVYKDSELRPRKVRREINLYYLDDQKIKDYQSGLEPGYFDYEKTKEEKAKWKKKLSLEEALAYTSKYSTVEELENELCFPTWRDNHYTNWVFPGVKSFG